MNHEQVAEAVRTALGPEALAYVATPYSKYAGGIDAAAREAERNAGFLDRHGLKVFSPIAHSHALARGGGTDPLDAQYWLGRDKWFIDRADALVVVKMDGWDQSVGVAHEIQKFAGRPIFMMDPVPAPVNVIGLMGYAGAGKSTVAGILRESYGFVSDHIKTPFANMLRTMLRDFGYDDATVESYIDGDLKRSVIPELGKTSTQVQQDLGTKWGRECIRRTIWTDLWAERMKAVLAGGGRVVQESVRFPEEAATVRALGGRIYLVNRPGTGPLNGHESESIPVEPDDVIENDKDITALARGIAALVA